MSSAKVTLLGMNAYFQNAGSDLFEFLSLPEGLNKQTLTDNILLEGGEFEVLYSTPLSLKTSIGIWSDREQATFQRWIDALAIDYAPLENYDRQETWTDTLDSDGTSRTTGTNDTSSRRVDDIDTSNSGTVSLDVSAYDSSGYQPKDKTTSSETGTHDQTSTETIDNDTTENTTTSLDNTGVHTGRVHGNIGTMTSQKMLSDELELGYWNIYSRITDMFLKEFCILIYV